MDKNLRKIKPRVTLKVNPRGRLERSEEKIRKKKFTYRIDTHKDIQILNLPKLPFGKHFNYNDSQRFTPSHFVSIESSRDSPELQAALKGYKFLKSKKKKPYFTTRDSTFLNKNKNFIVYKTNAGNLYTTKYNTKISQYESNKTFNPPLFDPNKNSPSPGPFIELHKENSRKSIKNIVSRLYARPKSPQNDAFVPLINRFSHLFV